jgi:hypothetical protein
MIALALRVLIGALCPAGILSLPEQVASTASRQSCFFLYRF